MSDVVKVSYMWAYLKVFVNIHRLKILKGVGVDLKGFSMEEHLNHDEFWKDLL